MTLKKTGHSQSRSNSASASIQEGIPEIQDGPEGYSEDAPSWESDDDQNKTSQNGYTTENSEADESTTKESSRVTVRAVPPARFGTPFTYIPYKNKEDFFIGLLDKATRFLFDQVVSEALTLRERLSDNRDDPHVCYLEGRESSSKDTDISEESDINVSELLIGTFPADTDRWLLDADLSIEVHRDRESEPGEIQYFVISNGCDTFRVNDWLVEPGVMGGPLPDFAVFQTGQYSYFWWRTAAALDYKPRFKRKRDLEDDDGESPRKAPKSNTDGSDDPSAESPSPNEPESPPNPQVFPDSKHWLEEYRRRLRICEQRPIKFTSSITAMHPPHQYLSGDMNSIDVILAIGAVWLGLMDAKVDFAYANSDLFSFARSMRRVGMHAVKGTNHFLMPLLFNEESPALSPEPEEDTAEPLAPVFSAFQGAEQQRHRERSATTETSKKKGPSSETRSPTPLEDQKAQNKSHEGGIGHFILAIAERISTDQATNVRGALTSRAPVRLKIMDSANGVVDKGLIRRAARNTVRHAGWLGDIWPRFDESQEYWVDVLDQSGNKSGEHTVLNAWAYMLDIPLATTRERGLGHSSYKEVRKMIVLALRGQLDSLTIRAWMQHSNYAEAEPLSQLQLIPEQQPDLPNKFRNMQTVALNQDAFNQRVEEIYVEEQADKQKHLMDWGAVNVKPNSRPMKLRVLPRVTLPPSGQNLKSTQDPASASSQISNASSLSIYDSINPRDPADTSPKTWQQSLDQRLKSNSDARVDKTPKTNNALKKASVIASSSNLADYHVVLGIAPIWEGLKRLGRPEFDFAYAGLDVFSPGGPQEEIGAVGGWSRFIMPLFFSRKDSRELENPSQVKGTIETVGHLLLCVAELVDVADARERPAMTVQLEILDSQRGLVSEEDIRRVAESKIRDSRWLGRKGHQGRVKYNVIFRAVPQQVGVNTCGLYTILNAWAYMLNIPIHPGRFRRGRDKTTINDNIDTEFLIQGRGIVQLALRGFMDSATIQAYFQKYGYAVEQRFGDPARTVVQVHAVGMNQEKLTRTLRLWDMIDKIRSARAQNRRFSDATIDLVRNQDPRPTRLQAWRALVMSKGHVDRASIRWQMWQPTGELPRPEEAFSPQTPAERRHLRPRVPD